MSKVRVYEYAKEHQVSSKKVIEALKDLGIEVANHMSTINENALRQLDNAIDGTNKKAEAPKKLLATKMEIVRGQTNQI